MIRLGFFAPSQAGITLLSICMSRCCTTPDRTLNLPNKWTFGLAGFTVKQNLLDAGKVTLDQNSLFFVLH